MLRLWQFSAAAQAVQSFHYVMPRGHSCMLLVVLVVLLFYVHGKHLRSCRDGQLT